MKGYQISEPYDVTLVCRIEYDSEKCVYRGVPKEYESYFPQNKLPHSNFLHSIPSEWQEFFKNAPENVVNEALEKSQQTDINEEQIAEMLKTSDPHDFLIDFHYIGEGLTSTVFTALSHKKIVVVKQMPIQKENIDLMASEIQIMAQLKSKYMVKMVSAHLVDDTIYIVMEYMDGGELSMIGKYIEFTESQIAYFAYKVLKGIDYLHSLNIIHRDIKTANIFLNSNGKAKIGDFGFATQLSDKHQKCDLIVGSPYRMAPEVFAGEKYSFPADIWSLGIMLRELADGEPPLADLAPKKAAELVEKHGLPDLREREEDEDEWSDEFLDFIGKCNILDPKKRPSAHNLLKHPFLESRCKSKEITHVVQTAKEDAENDLMGAL